jgi:hydroxymethylglutaryl-CoA reductase (NADPH)
LIPEAAGASAERRRAFLREASGVELTHVAKYSFDPSLVQGTGQDAADISEYQAAVTYSQLLDNGDYYWSVTLTSLVVGTVGGGTGLATQRECLEMLGCHGQGKADKFAEICAGVALAGETSLASAVLSGDWVSSHERLGRRHA